MPTQTELDKTYMECALAHSRLSKAKRKKVGACLVTPQGIVIPGYNGTPAKTSNVCEAETVQEVYTGSGTLEPFKSVSVLHTLPTVIHAELNCILKAASAGLSVANSVMYITLSPCIACSAFLVQCGVRRLVYLEDYRCTSGVDYLRNCNIEVIKYEGELNVQWG